VNSKEEVKESPKEAEAWNGPLNRYNTYTSHKEPNECMKVIEEGLDTLEKEKLVDWEIEGYNVFGRMYHGFDMSEYMINVYVSSDNQYQSVIEIRRSSGDTFVHDEFFRRISKYLEEQSVLEHREEVDFGFSFALEPLTLDSLDSEFLKQLEKDDNVTSEDDGISSEATDTTSIQHLGDELIEVVTDRWSYREVFRHTSGVLCQELQTNPQLVQYVVSQTNIIQRLIKPLTEELYDSLIIRNILQVVKKLLEHETSKVSVYDNCAKDIRDLKEKWMEGPQHKTISMRFGRSQQVERACSECLNLLQSRF